MPRFRLPAASLALAAAVLALASAAPVQAAHVCVTVKTGALAGNCVDIDAGEKSCTAVAGCSNDPTSQAYCQYVESSKDCAAWSAAPGCCFCGTAGSTGVWSDGACKAKCGGGSYKYFKENACTGAEVDAYKKQVGGVDVSKGKPAAKVITLTNPLGTTSVPEVIGRVINTLLGISGSLALLMFIYGGFVWITSGGSPDRITTGKRAMVWAALGLVLIFSSYAALSYVFKTLSA